MRYFLNYALFLKLTFIMLYKRIMLYYNFTIIIVGRQDNHRHIQFFDISYC